jgi:FtsH-binding integral membrane protein
MNNQISTFLSQEEIEREQSSFIAKVYGWMSGALCITALIAYATANSPELVSLIFGNKLVFWGLLLGELALVVWLSAAVASMSAQTAIMAFLGYSALNGLTLASVFLVFTEESLVSTFLVTAGTFGVMSVYGYTTKRDLTSMGNLLGMGLVGLILASVVNMFLNSSMLYWITTYIGVFIFVGLIAYDTQKIKEMNVIGNEGTEEDRKEAIMGALTLYLDFINLFLYMLRLFGNRKD